MGWQQGMVQQQAQGSVFTYLVDDGGIPVVHLLHPDLQLLLDVRPHVLLLLAGSQHALQVVPHHVRRNHLHQGPETHDHLRSEVALPSNVDQGIHVDSLDEGVGLQELCHENSNRPDVLGVSLQEEGLDIGRYLLVGKLSEFLLRHSFPGQEEIEGKYPGQVFSGNLALDVLVQLAETYLPWLPEPQHLQQLNNLMEVFGPLIVVVAHRIHNLVFRVSLNDVLTVSLGNPLGDVLLDGLLAVPRDAGQEEGMSGNVVPLLLPALLLILEDAVVDCLEDFLLGDVIHGHVGELGVLVLEFSHHPEVHGGVVDWHFQILGFGSHFNRLGLQLFKFFPFVPQLLLALLGGLGRIGEDLQTLDAVEKILISDFVFLEAVLDHLDVFLTALELVTDDLLILLEAGHSYQQQALDETLEEVVDVDRPKTGLAVDGCIQSEQQVCQNLQVVRNPVELTQAALRVSEGRKQKVVRIVNLLGLVPHRLAVVPAVLDLVSHDLPEDVQTDVDPLLLEGVAAGVDHDPLLPLHLLVEMHLDEVLAEEGRHDGVFEVALSEVLDEFLSLFELLLGVEDANFLEEGFRHQFVIDGSPRNLQLDKGKDFDDFRVPFDFEQSLSEHQCELGKLAIVQYLISVAFLRSLDGGSDFEVGVDGPEVLEGELIDVGVEDVGDEVEFASVLGPVVADRVDVEGVHHDIPLFEDVHQFQLGKFLLPEGSDFFWQDVEDIFDLSFDFLVELDGLVGVDRQQSVLHEFVDVGFFLDVQFFENVFVVEDALDDVELFPLDQNFSVGQQEFPLGHVVVDRLEDVQQHRQHVPAVVQRDLLVLDPHRVTLALLVEILLQQNLEDLVVALVLEHVEVGQLLAVEDVEDAQAPPDLDDLVHLHAQVLGQLDLLHQLDEVLGVRVFPNLQLHAEPLDEQLDQGLVVDLEVSALVEHFLDEDLELNPGTVFGVDELPDGVVEVVGIAVQLHVQVPELVEDELLPLPVLQKEQRNQVLIRKLDELFSGEPCPVVVLLLAKVVLEHELVHRSVQPHRLVGVPDQSVLLLEDLHQGRGELVLVVVLLLVGKLADLQEESVVVDFPQLFLVLVDGATDQAVLLQFFGGPVGGVDQGVDSI